jgi:hypothetical protein
MSGISENCGEYSTYLYPSGIVDGKPYYTGIEPVTLICTVTTGSEILIQYNSGSTQWEAYKDGNGPQSILTGSTSYPIGLWDMSLAVDFGVFKTECSPYVTPVIVPYVPDPCSATSMSVSVMTYTPTPTPTLTPTPTPTPTISRLCNYNGIVTFNTLDDYIVCPNSKQFKDCTNGAFYYSNGVVLSPNNDIPIVGNVYLANINNVEVCVTFMGLSENISGNNQIKLIKDNGSEVDGGCFRCASCGDKSFQDDECFSFMDNKPYDFE